MGTLNENLVALLGRTLQQSNGVTGRYIRGAAEAEIEGIPASLTLQQRGASEAVVGSREQDWLFRKDDLRIDDDPITPRRGDKWATDHGAYEVVERGEPSAWRFTDESHELIRVYTNEV